MSKYMLSVVLDDDDSDEVVQEVNSWPVEAVQTPLTAEEAYDVFAVISSAAATWFAMRERQLKRNGGAG